MSMSDSWSPSAKKIARRAYDQALQRELAELLVAFKRKAASAAGSDDLWSIELWLQAQRQEIDTKYDYRYSRLIGVFATLRHQGFIDIDDLAGLSSDKIAEIERYGAVSMIGPSNATEPT